MEESQIQKFYKGRNVFVTGGTGFMGKALIEKLLRDTDVETIYVLIREKKGQTPHMRIDSLFDDVIFDRVKIEKPKCRNKVEAIPGDCTIAGLGMSIIDRQKLISNIDIVFHVAATVNFNEHLKLAYNINLNGTKDLLNLAREMINLKSIIHVSTAYSNCQRDQIDEEIYDHPVKSSDLEVLLEKMTDEEVSSCESKILGEWPNTYTFTKALAESLVKEMSGTMPLGVFRPGIVVSTYREPIPGWIDNLYGPTGVAVGTVSGVLRVSPCDSNKRADVVPVDTCICGLIASAWDVAERKEERKPDNIPVYNYVTSPENPILWEEFLRLSFLHGVSYVPSNAIWCPYAIITTNVYLYWILKLVLHTLPGLLIDFCTLLVGGEPKLLKLYKKIHKFSELIAFFCMREWNFTNSNTQQLWKKLNKTDQEKFPLSMNTVHWTKYFRTYVKGVRKYLLKDDDSTLERSRMKNRRFMLAHNILTMIVVCLSSYLFISLISKVCNCILGNY